MAPPPVTRAVFPDHHSQRDLPWHFDGNNPRGVCFAVQGGDDDDRSRHAVHMTIEDVLYLAVVLGAAVSLT